MHQIEMNLMENMLNRILYDILHKCNPLINLALIKFDIALLIAHQKRFCLANRSVRSVTNVSLQTITSPATKCSLSIA